VALRKDGSRFHAHVFISQVQFPDGPVSLAFIFDITERKRAEEELGRYREHLEEMIKERTEDLRRSRDELEVRVQERTRELEEANVRLRQIPSQLIYAQEEERKRLASELHDSIGQTLAALKFRMEFVGNTLRNDEEEALRLIEEFIPTIQRSIDETRAIYMGLRPKVLEDFGVIAALFWYREGLLNLNPTMHIEIEISIDESDIPQDLTIPIFRIAQEALNNATKHSKSEWIDVRLVRNGAEIEVVVSDDGVGMDIDHILQSTTARSLGLTSMRERAELTGGKFTIESTLGEGTTVRVCWPK
jgi:signal transduction histidine kinase